jgi:hypothetical protein
LCELTSLPLTIQRSVLFVFSRQEKEKLEPLFLHIMIYRLMIGY